MVALSSCVFSCWDLEQLGIPAQQAAAAVPPPPRPGGDTASGSLGRAAGGGGCRGGGGLRERRPVLHPVGGRRGLGLLPARGGDEEEGGSGGGEGRELPRPHGARCRPDLTARCWCGFAAESGRVSPRLARSIVPAQFR